MADLKNRPSRGGTRLVALPGFQKQDESFIPTLSIVSGPRVGTVFRFPPTAEDSQTVGRTSDAQIVISDPTLSSLHARFSWKKVENEFRMELEDLCSTNGCSVKGRRVLKTLLDDGDLVYLGAVQIRFQRLRLSELAERDRLIAKATEADTDPLTRLANRRYMEENVPKMLKDANDRGLPVSVLLLDLDHFKQVNDTYGHSVGDEVLKVIAKTVQSRIRGSDVAVRYGGEEFILFLPGSSPREAELVAERVRFTVASFDATFIAPQLKLTVSIGLSEYAHGEPWQQVIERADRALYRAKQAGRNRVEVCLP